MRLLAAVLLAAVGLLVGCAAPIVIASAGANALQAGTSAFINGELDAAQIALMETVYEATIDALSDLQLPVTSKRLGKGSAGINAQEVRGRHIRIELIAKSPVVTKINIRVGLLGDQAISRLILGEIQARCPARPVPEPLPPAAPQQAPGGPGDTPPTGTPPQSG